MAVQRDDPYGAFNFKVTIAPDSGGEIKAGFSDVSGLGTEVIHADDRVGTDPANHPRKVPLMHKASEVTLKRCLAGGLALFQWIDQVRQGKQDAKATVTIELMSEDRSAAVLGWKLSGAQPSKFTGSTLAAKRGTEVAMEELVLVCEDIGMERVRRAPSHEQHDPPPRIRHRRRLGAPACPPACTRPARRQPRPGWCDRAPPPSSGLRSAGRGTRLRRSRAPWDLPGPSAWRCRGWPCRKPLPPASPRLGGVAWLIAA